MSDSKSQKHTKKKKKATGRSESRLLCEPFTSRSLPIQEKSSPPIHWHPSRLKLSLRPAEISWLLPDSPVEGDVEGILNSSFVLWQERLIPMVLMQMQS